ncbi:hypothetical protein W97_07559 [Coniosporium apollinis CBS 100218]|uniref:Short chain dehydrogenase n=1 Tax=Coniosporium apollinis (strain CBS 100218) TaxID=1168221 RepID=R7Z2Z8_CONA1|nr:uncharacterized protein W97_07559 [Coniosporium apollinis CBS 100218]EON68301.1 hypothetical protein W97_07559 [Coniosporium apollinis CBS 100218]
MSATKAPQTIVLITGANQGLGFEVAKKLAAEQANYHILLGSRNPQKGQDAASCITNLAENTSVQATEIDILSDASIQRCVSEVEARHGRLDVLLNNAAIGRVDESSRREEMMRVVETNAVSAWCVTEEFAPLLKKSEAPRVVMMTSGLGSLGMTLDPARAYYGLDAPAYKVSKAAMNMVAAVEAVKYAKDGIKVNVVCPGFRKTNLNGYSEMAGDPADGAIEACRVIIMGKEGPTGRFTTLEGEYPW